jgi:hypothetical protein
MAEVIINNNWFNQQKRSKDTDIHEMIWQYHFDFIKYINIVEDFYDQVKALRGLSTKDFQAAYLALDNRRKGAHDLALNDIDILNRLALQENEIFANIDGANRTDIAKALCIWCNSFVRPVSQKLLADI